MSPQPPLLYPWKTGDIAERYREGGEVWELVRVREIGEGSTVKVTRLGRVEVESECARNLRIPRKITRREHSAGGAEAKSRDLLP